MLYLVILHRGHLNGVAALLAAFDVSEAITHMGVDVAGWNCSGAIAAGLHLRLFHIVRCQVYIISRRPFGIAAINNCAAFSLYFSKHVRGAQIKTEGASERSEPQSAVRANDEAIGD